MQLFYDEYNMLDLIHEVHDVNQSQRAFSTGMNIHVGAARAVVTGFNVTLTYRNRPTVIWIFIFIFNCKMTWNKLTDGDLEHLIVWWNNEPLLWTTRLTLVDRPMRTRTSRRPH